MSEEDGVTGEDAAAAADRAAGQVDWPEGVEFEPRVQQEVNYIVHEFYENGLPVQVVFSEGKIDYICSRDRILVRDEYLFRVIQILWRSEEKGQPAAEDIERIIADQVVEPVIAGVVLLSLEAIPHDVPTALQLIDELLGAGIATPNHVLTVAGTTGICPATEPQEAYAGIEPFPPVCPAGGGAGVLVYIADTGLMKDQTTVHSWLAGVKGEADPGTPAAGSGSMPPILPYTAHGTFVAGVARCMAPAADVFVDDVFKIAGSALEAHMVKKLVRALRRGADVIHLSIAAATRRDLPLVAFAKWLDLLGQYKGVACVVAAGNSSSYLPSWPAAFPQVVSVGALAADWRSRAQFSNYGGWVDVYAPGRDLINAYTTGDYTCQIAPYAPQIRHFYGMARWSGTSFSTPIVTGLIAARMSRTGENGQEAAAALLAKARSQAIPGVGAILLPCCDDDACAHPARCRPAGCCPAHHPCPQVC